jgi:hypothetical protein
MPDLLALDAAHHLGQLRMVRLSQQPVVCGIGGPFVDHSEGHVHSDEVLADQVGRQRAGSGSGFRSNAV